jgi:hypothetical protein
MKVGDVVTVYMMACTRNEVCDKGITHNVPIYWVKRIKVVLISSELVKGLNYVSDGMGDVLYATDAQGRQYRKQPHWDGPRATLWVREDRAVFDQYPTRMFSRDLYGRPLHLESTRISVVH